MARLPVGMAAVAAATGALVLAAWGAAQTDRAALGAVEVVRSPRTQAEVDAARTAQEEKLNPLKYQAQKFEYAGEKGYPASYRLSPPKPEVGGRKYPLVILYGGNLTGANPFALPEYQAKYPCFVMEIAAAVPKEDLGPDKPWKQKVAQTTQAVVEELLKKYAIDPDRIYATGHSAGGGLVWATAIEYPELFAAIAPSAATCDISQAPLLVEHRVAMWVLMGAKDSAVGIDNPRGARAMVEAIIKAGGHVKYTEYVNLGHVYACLLEPDFSALLEWMFAQRRPPAAKPGARAPATAPARIEKAPPRAASAPAAPAGERN